MKINKRTSKQKDKWTDAQRGIPVVDGGVGEEGHVGGELAPEPEDTNKKQDN